MKHKYSFSVYTPKRNYLESYPFTSLTLSFLFPVLFYLFSESFFLLLRSIRSCYACALYVRDASRSKEKERESYLISFPSGSPNHRYRPHTLSFGLSAQKKRRKRRKKRADVKEVRGNEAEKSELKKADRPQPFS